MILLVIYLFSVLVAMGAAVMSAVSDVRGMKIPNVYPVLVLGAFVTGFAACYVAGVEGQVFQSWTQHLASGGVLFVAGFILFAMKAFGAGDSKLMAAFGFWFGLKALFCFVFYTSFVGGLVALVTLLLRRYRPFKTAKEGGWIARAQSGQMMSVPYGIAIALGAFISFLYSGYFSLDVMSVFIEGQQE